MQEPITFPTTGELKMSDAMRLLGYDGIQGGTELIRREQEREREKSETE